MDEDLLRKQLTEEIQAQFEAKLREAKRQKAEAEEELEGASERWRIERRRLNSEIDRLEAALTEKAPKGPKRAAEVKQPGISLEEVAKIQKAAEDKLKSAMGEWQAERERLQLQNTRLERAVAEAIERSSNPIRTTQAIKEQFEARLDEAEKQRMEVEQELLRVRVAWDEDKKRLMGEIMKLRRLAPSKAYEVKEKIERIHGHAESLEEKRIRELETKLGEARAEAGRYYETAVKAQQELATSNKQIQQLRESAPMSHEGNGAEKVDELRRAYDTKIQEYARDKEHHQSRIAALEADLVKARHEIELSNQSEDAIQERLSKASREMDSLRQTLAETREQITSGAVDQVRDNQDERIQQLSRQQEETQKTISSLKMELAAARDEIGNQIRLKEQTQTKLANASKDIESLQRTLSQTREQVSSEVMEQIRQQYDSKIEDVIQQKTHLAQELESATALLQTERSRFASEVSKPKGSPGLGSNGLESEVKRIEEMIQGLVSLIEDPSTDLSTVIRKNVEKAELNAYLRGILFSLGRANAM